MKYTVLIAGASFLFTFIVLALILPFNDLTIGEQGRASSFLIVASLLWVSHFLVGLLGRRYLTRDK